MKSTIGWIVAILVGLLLLILLLSVWMFGRSWMGGYGGMMGGINSMHPFGWGGMFLVWLIPVGVIVLLVLGAVTLINSFNRSGQLTQLKFRHELGQGAELWSKKTSKQR